MQFIVVNLLSSNKPTIIGVWDFGTSIVRNATLPWPKPDISPDNLFCTKSIDTNDGVYECRKQLSLRQTTDPDKGTRGNWFFKCQDNHFEWITITDSERRALNSGNKIPLGVTQTESRSGYESNIASRQIFA